MRHLIIYVIVASICFYSCEEPQIADMIIYNATIETMTDIQSDANSIAIKDGKIFTLGNFEDLEVYKDEHTEMIDAKGHFVMPGFIEGHGHFSGLGSSLMNLNFLKSKSWQEIVQMVADKAESSEKGEWITGRGWHQEKWVERPQNNVLGYPMHYDMSEVTPDNPVILFHASGHGLFANEAAMKIAGITRETQSPDGGEIVRSSGGEAIGIFEERAMSLIRDAYSDYLKTLSPEDLEDQWYEAIDLAEEECIKKGITSFQDAGSSFQEIERYQKMAESGELDLRLYAMLRHSFDVLKESSFDGLPVKGAGNNFFTCRAIKSEVDGALGAFGAWLLAPYEDKPDFVGQNTTPITSVKGIGELAQKHEMQLCVHAIGDKANQVVLDLMDHIYSQSENKDLRWRIEHAQHLSTKDIPRFAELGVIASMQGIHCTSDAPFVEKRLGEQRSKEGAYPWRSLIDSGALIANGTDAPVEDVDPIESFYASVTRKRSDSGFEFFTEQKMTRMEALKSYTIWNAFAAFEEDIKGSIEPGKYADIVILSKDLRSCSDEEILDCQVMSTIINGKIKHSIL